MCKEGAKTIGQDEVCSFLLKEMQQRESQVKAHFTLPVSHHPSFTNMTNTKVYIDPYYYSSRQSQNKFISQETVCGVLHLPNPPQYMTVSKVKYYSKSG